jgi:hypothetical protein
LKNEIEKFKNDHITSIFNQTISNKDIEIKNLSNINNEQSYEMKKLSNSIVKLTDDHNTTLKQVI